MTGGEIIAAALGIIPAFFASWAVAKAGYAVATWLPAGIIVLAVWTLAVAAI